MLGRSGFPLSDGRRFSDPAWRSGAGKSKEKAEGDQTQAATRGEAGGSAGHADATAEHGTRIVGLTAGCNGGARHRYFRLNSQMLTDRCDEDGAALGAILAC